MYVSVNKARAHIAPLQIDGFIGLVTLPECGHFLTGNGDIGQVDLAIVNIDQAGIFEQDIGRLVAPSDSDEFFGFHRLLFILILSQG